MTKNKEGVSTEAVQDTETNENLPVSQNSPIADIAKDMEVFAESAKSLEKMKTGSALNFHYLEMEKEGDSKRLVFLGFGEVKMTDEDSGEVIPHKAVRFMDSDKSLFISASVALVSTIEQIGLPAGTPILITYKGKKKRTKLFDINHLN